MATPLESSAIDPLSVQPEVAQPTLQEQAAQVIEIVAWMEDLWANDAEARKQIDKKDWKRFTESIYDWLSEIEALYRDD